MNQPRVNNNVFARDLWALLTSGALDLLNRQPSVAEVPPAKLGISDYSSPKT